MCVIIRGFSMKWIKYEKQRPRPGMLIAAIRYRYPAFFWLGKWKTPRDETDNPDYWIKAPKSELKP